MWRVLLIQLADICDLGWDKQQIMDGCHSFTPQEHRCVLWLGCTAAQVTHFMLSCQKSDIQIQLMSLCMKLCCSFSQENRTDKVGL